MSLKRMLCFRYSLRSEVADILTSGKVRWNSLARQIIDKCAYDLRVASLIRQSICCLRRRRRLRLYRGGYYEAGFLYYFRRYEMVDALTPVSFEMAVYDNRGGPLCCGLSLPQRRSDRYERSNLSLQRGLVSWSIGVQREFLEVLII
ncbi:hypothetical protein FGO68_gene8453 [Halteria grandinella]|uniref:Uncharacterized protein n=1 Tax=Halteria grandinella TaxID=5974 RepID=A0A8J8NAE6_HALGN|nr:hypothetical protein FGO68_gene8453 [Halteria grandinella]